MGETTDGVIEVIIRTHVEQRCGLTKEIRVYKGGRMYCGSHQKVMVQPEADSLNHGPRRTALGCRLLLFFSINMKWPAVSETAISIQTILSIHFTSTNNMFHQTISESPLKTAETVTKADKWRGSFAEQLHLPHCYYCRMEHFYFPLPQRLYISVSWL